VNTIELLINAAKEGVTFWLDDGRLAYRAPKGKITGEFRDEIIRHKEELISMMRQENHGVLSQIPSHTRSEDNDHPLSSGQERIWLIERRIGQSALHNVHFRLAWKGSLDRDILALSLQEIATRHVPLRTTFTEIDGAPRAIVSRDSAVELAHLDLTAREPRAKASAARSFILDYERSPFDLERGPLMRAGVITLAENDHLFLVTQHHIITDGWSVGIFLAELERIYRTRALNDPVPLAELPLSYLDYTRWQREWCSAQIYRSNMEWWKDHLSALPPLALRIDDHVHPPTPDYTGATEQFRIPGTLESQLRDLAREQQCTLYTVLLAAWAILLYRHSGQPDFAIGTITSGRDRQEFQQLLGFFANTVVLRCDLSGNPSVIETISRLRAETKLALEREVQYSDAILAASAMRGIGLNPLIQAAFVFENIPIARTLNLKDAQGTEAEISLDPQIDSSVAGTTKFDLALFVKESYGDIDGCIRYATAKFCAPVIQRLRERFLAVLENMVKDPSERVARLALLGANERQKLLVEWSGREPGSLPGPRSRLHCQRILPGSLGTADHTGQRQAG
jgi:Condensation domain/TubC N-terminal docking domain